MLFSFSSRIRLQLQAQTLWFLVFLPQASNFQDMYEKGSHHTLHILYGTKYIKNVQFPLQERTRIQIKLAALPVSLSFVLDSFVILHSLTRVHGVFRLCSFQLFVFPETTKISLMVS